VILLDLFVHDKNNNIKVFAVGLAIGVKAVCHLGLVINRHVQGLIVVEQQQTRLCLSGLRP